MRKMALVVALIILFTCLGEMSAQAKTDHDEILVRIKVDNTNELQMLEDFSKHIYQTRISNIVEAVVNQSQLEEIQRQGLKPDIIGGPAESVLVDPEYHTYQEVMSLLDSLASTFPDITFLDTIGTSQRHGNYIVALKISDNPQIEEDEPAVLYDGHHHAREAIGMETCLAIIDFLLNNYGIDSRVTNWINDTEIWFIPMLNPDGWKYIVEQNVASPYWRKNQRDNNNNGIFDENYDGVDLNRNYDFHWVEGGSGSPTSWNYRGAAPFSESEVRAKRDLANNQNFILSLTYHSSGEVIFYPWVLDGNLAPDNDLIVALADSVASRIPKISGVGHYNISPGNGNGGYSDVWMYGVMGCIEMTVETSTTSLPAGTVAMQIAQDNINGALYLLDRVHGPGITGHITDLNTGAPLSAKIKIIEIYDPSITPRKSENLYGRYYRLLLPGIYTVEISKEGYQTITKTNIVVGQDSLTELNVALDVVSSIDNELVKQNPISNFTLNQNFPNPFNPITTIRYNLDKNAYVDLSIFNAMGQELETLVSERQKQGEYQIQWDGSKYASGIYYYRLQVGNNDSEIRKMAILK